MKNRILSTISYPAVAMLTAILALFILLPSQPTWAEDKAQAMIGGVTPEEAMRLGEKMYREGILPSGEPMKATVKGDVPVDGKMFTCVSCHLRSGFGTSEGQARTPPIDGTRLYSPISKFREVLQVGKAAIDMGGELFRPAYTDETLAACIEGGVDPTNRQLNSIMPLYPLEKEDMAILVYYLKNFSVGNQPGVSQTTLHFATVITEEVPKEDREAMLTPLQEFIDHWRIPERMERTIKGKSQRQEGGASHDLRKLTLSVWELKGPSDTWRKQLEDYYKKDPVFALLGGISTKEWAPIHQFCEDLKIPALFPLTDLPVISKTDWHTFYLSKGLSQEGEAAARFLHAKEGMADGQEIIQVYRDEASGTALANAFRQTWESLGHKTPETLVLAGNETLPSNLWTKISQKPKQAVVLLWLNDHDFLDLRLLAKNQPWPAMIMASYGLLGKTVYSLPESERSNLFLTYPYALPEEAKGYRTHFAATSTAKTLPLYQRELAMKMKSLFTTVAGAISKLRTYVYRDYFIELIESTPDLESGQIIYSKLSFGQGQRYASKGCHVVQLGTGVQPKLIMRSAWVIQ